MTLLNQPSFVQIGGKLKELLQLDGEDRFDTFYFLVAYVRKSGVDQLKPSIEQFRHAGGKVKAVVGVGQKHTSIQGLMGLLAICDKVSVYHNRSYTSTFHPKVYAFEKRRERAVLFVGSSNLTGGGLYTNYEANYLVEYDLHDQVSAKNYSAFKQMFKEFSTPSGFSKNLSLELIQRMNEGDRKYLSDESEETEEENKGREGTETEKAIFDFKRICAPTTPASSRGTEREASTGLQQLSGPVTPADLFRTCDRCKRPILLAGWTAHRAAEKAWDTRRRLNPEKWGPRKHRKSLRG